MLLNSTHFKFAFQLLFLFVVGCRNSPSPSGNNILENANTSKLKTVDINANRVDTLFKDYHHEPELSGGYKFGMTQTEWNRILALKAKTKVIENLEDDGGTYKGFLSFGKNLENDQRFGYYLEGVFASSRSNSDKVEVLRLDGRVVDEPILIGIKQSFLVPSRDVGELIDVIRTTDKLKLIAGQPLKLDYLEVTKSDLQSEVQAEMEKFAGGPVSNTISHQRDYISLFEGRQFYSELRVSESVYGNVAKDHNYRVVAVNNAYRNFSLVQTLYSKTQGNIDIEDYQTDEEKQEAEYKRTTNRLIEKALK